MYGYKNSLYNKKLDFKYLICHLSFLSSFPNLGLQRFGQMLQPRSSTLWVWRLEDWFQWQVIIKSTITLSEMPYWYQSLTVVLRSSLVLSSSEFLDIRYIIMIFFLIPSYTTTYCVTTNSLGIRQIFDSNSRLIIGNC